MSDNRAVNKFYVSIFQWIHSFTTSPYQSSQELALSKFHPRQLPLTNVNQTRSISRNLTQPNSNTANLTISSKLTETQQTLHNLTHPHAASSNISQFNKPQRTSTHLSQPTQHDPPGMLPCQCMNIVQNDKFLRKNCQKCFSMF